MRGNDSGVVKIKFSMTKDGNPPRVSFGWSPSVSRDPWTQEGVSRVMACPHRDTDCQCSLPKCGAGMGDRDAMGMRVTRGQHTTLANCLACRENS